MTRFTEEAISNLRKGAAKMERVMTPAAKIRRDFRSGRPPKDADALPLHPSVVWQRSIGALTDLRTRMEAAKLDPKHATASLVLITEENPIEPILFSIGTEAKSLEQLRTDLFALLASGSAMAIGLIFRQYDEEAKNIAFFPYQFTGLSEAGVLVLKIAALRLEALQSLASKTAD